MPRKKDSASKKAKDEGTAASKEATDTPREESDAADTAAKEGTGEKAKKSAEELLDAIDDILEKDTEEFLESYVQRGGE